MKSLHLWGRALVTGGCVAMMAGAPRCGAQTPTLVGDLAQSSIAALGSAPCWLTPFGGGLLFVATTPEHGAELWISDGTMPGTREVKDIAPGPRGSQPSCLTPLGGRVIFAADTPEAGSELWSTDGTPEGTAMLADLEPGRRGSGPQELRAWGGKVYFFARSSATGRELWSTDGTPAGMGLVADVKPGPEGSAGSQLTPSGPWLYFVANDGVSGLELYRTDGGPQGGVRLGDRIPGNNGIYPAATRLTDVRGRLFVLLNGTSFPSNTLTPALVDHVSGEAATIPVSAGSWVSTRVLVGDSAVVRSRVILTSLSAASASTLYWIDADEAAPRLRELFSDPALAPLGIPPTSLTAVGPLLYCVARTASGPRLVKVDPVTGGHAMLATAFSEIGELGAVNNRLYFTARTTDAGAELWTIDPSFSARRLAVINPGVRGAMPQNLTLANDGTTVYFSAVSATAGQELWRVSVPALCRPDVDASGELDPDDLADFVACFFASSVCPEADVDGDGVVTPDDLSDFIGLYFGGCPG